MIKLRPANERGHANHGWLDTRFSFSFADYFDPAHLGFRNLRVINEDHISPATGFGRHPHKDMEIVTYMIAGELEHQDSMGNKSVIRGGEVQRMSAGTGVYHSEMNASPTDAVHLLQIWIFPNREGLKPSYEQRAFDQEAKRGRWLLIAGTDGHDGAMIIHQNVDLFAACLAAGERLEYRLKPMRHAWLQMVRGGAALNGVALKSGDGAAVSQEELLNLQADEESEILLFDLA